MLITKTTPTVNSYEDILLFKNVKIYTEKNTVLHTMLSVGTLFGFDFFKINTKSHR